MKTVIRCKHNFKSSLLCTKIGSHHTSPAESSASIVPKCIGPEWYRRGSSLKVNGTSASKLTNNINAILGLPHINSNMPQISSSASHYSLQHNIQRLPNPDSRHFPFPPLYKLPSLPLLSLSTLPSQPHLAKCHSESPTPAATNVPRFIPIYKSSLSSCFWQQDQHAMFADIGGVRNSNLVV